MQVFVGTLPFVAIALSAIVFLVPGMVAGAIGARAAFLNGVILGLISAALVTLQAAQFRLPDWSSILVYESISVWACIGVPLCVLGAAIGRSLVRRI
jgi:fructose-specific phosphotransferase system IIC component